MFLLRESQCFVAAAKDQYISELPCDYEKPKSRWKSRIAQCHHKTWFSGGMYWKL